ncbi:hypothetical protein CH267_13100 [Rhodococcus sp. 06-621-2]|nr:MaoC family dehydratase N-terminal domain-containing protein [Rhodococcus sp. 06-621-2]OZC55507.1 hypothetical protein CH267_13100 [Rhodococcus sp. 06-621-2]
MTESTTRTSVTLEQHVEGWRPEAVVTTDAVRREQVDQLIDTLDLDASRFGGSALPILWHWIAFQDWPPSGALGEDGHPSEGHFYPPIPNRRRMFAGSDVTSHRPWIIDEPTTRRSSLASVTPKTGASGDMLFVTIENEYSQQDTLVRTELQKIVYRSEASGSTRGIERSTAEPTPIEGATSSADHAVDSRTLFRFSALTANAHRIHYDAPYAIQVEGYPGLVVHGPLLAVFMADLTEQAWGVGGLGKFAFRLRHPIFDGDRFLAEGTFADSGTSADLVITSGKGAAATATAVRA